MGCLEILVEPSDKFFQHFLDTYYCMFFHLAVVFQTNMIHSPILLTTPRLKFHQEHILLMVASLAGAIPPQVHIEFPEILPQC